jgi:hypothetical protein
MGKPQLQQPNPASCRSVNSTHAGRFARTTITDDPAALWEQFATVISYCKFGHAAEKGSFAVAREITPLQNRI